MAAAKQAFVGGGLHNAAGYGEYASAVMGEPVLKRTGLVAAIACAALELEDLGDRHPGPDGRGHGFFH